jgi:peptidoglycan/xylan/chitin deacetylase (PgdA/CDA1 family)
MTVRGLWRRALVRGRRHRGGDPALAILVYHSVVRRALEVEDFCFIREQEFRAQLDLLRQRFQIVHLEEAARLLEHGAARGPMAVLTFDDGFQDNFDVVYPMLRAAGVPATIFVCTDFIDTNRVPWYCRLHDALTRTRQSQLSWDRRRFDLDGTAARTRAADVLKRTLKRLPHPTLESAVDDISKALEPDAESGAPTDPRFRMLTSAAIREMAASGLVEFGAHTGSHAILGKLSRREQRDEIERSISAVGNLTGKECRLFAYPNGRFDDYDDASLEILRTAGIATAVTAEEGWNDAATPPLELLRYPIGGEPSMPRFERVLRRLER